MFCKFHQEAPFDYYFFIEAPSVTNNLRRIHYWEKSVLIALPFVYFSFFDYFLHHRKNKEKRAKLQNIRRKEKRLNMLHFTNYTITRLLKKATYVQKCRQVLFNEYFIFDRFVCRFHIHFICDRI